MYEDLVKANLRRVNKFCRFLKTIKFYSADTKYDQVVGNIRPLHYILKQGAMAA